MPPYAVRVRTATGWQDIALQGKSVAVYEQPNEPAGAVIGDIWIDTDAPTPTPLVTRTFQVGRTWSIAGPLVAATLPGYYVSLAPSQTGKIVAVRRKLLSGTQINGTLTKNGIDIADLTSFGISTSAFTTSVFGLNIANDDDIGLKLASPIGSPVGLQLTVFEEHTA